MPVRAASAWVIHLDDIEEKLSLMVTPACRRVQRMKLSSVVSGVVSVSDLTQTGWWRCDRSAEKKPERESPAKNFYSHGGGLSIIAALH